MQPTEEEQVELDEILAKRQKRGKVTEDKSMDEKSILHSKYWFLLSNDILTNGTLQKTITILF